MRAVKVVGVVVGGAAEVDNEDVGNDGEGDEDIETKEERKRRWKRRRRVSRRIKRFMKTDDDD